ncbi:MAG: hypothetical protein AVDCRST_MAG19-372, partial [uncultured Thermomicrobiales bacterium]
GGSYARGSPRLGAPPPPRKRVRSPERERSRRTGCGTRRKPGVDLGGGRPRVATDAAADAGRRARPAPPPRAGGERRCHRSAPARVGRSRRGGGPPRSGGGAAGPPRHRRPVADRGAPGRSGDGGSGERPEPAADAAPRGVVPGRDGARPSPRGVDERRCGRRSCPRGDGGRAGDPRGDRGCEWPAVGGGGDGERWRAWPRGRTRDVRRRLAPRGSAERRGQAAAGTGGCGSEGAGTAGRRAGCRGSGGGPGARRRDAAPGTRPGRGVGRFPRPARRRSRRPRRSRGNSWVGQRRLIPRRRRVARARAVGPAAAPGTVRNGPRRDGARWLAGGDRRRARRAGRGPRGRVAGSSPGVRAAGGEGGESDRRTAGLDGGVGTGGRTAAFARCRPPGPLSRRPPRDGDAGGAGCPVRPPARRRRVPAALRLVGQLRSRRFRGGCPRRAAATRSPGDASADAARVPGDGRIPRRSGLTTPYPSQHARLSAASNLRSHRLRSRGCGDADAAPPGAAGRRVAAGATWM